MVASMSAIVVVLFGHSPASYAGWFGWGGSSSAERNEVAAPLQQQVKEFDNTPEEEEEILLSTEEESVPLELMDFMEHYEESSQSLRGLEEARLKVGFRRSVDGRVSLLSSTGDWFAVKADMQVPGYLLLRDPEGYLYYLPPSGTGQIQQFDLSDDLMVAQLFANRAWEDVIEPLDAEQEDGKTSPLRMSESDFRHVLSLLEDALAGEEEPLEDMGELGMEEGDRF